MSKLGFSWDYPAGDCRITDDLGGVHMATLHEMTLIGEVEQLQSKLEALTNRAEAAEADWQAAEERDRKGTEIIVDLTLRQDRLVEVLKVTAGNIRSLGPAGQLHEPYRPWLKAVEDAIEEAK